MSRDYLTRLLQTGTLPYRKKGNRHLVAVAVDLETFNVERDRRLDELDRNPVCDPSSNRLASASCSTEQVRVRLL